MDLLKSLLQSKKFVATIIGVITTLAARKGFNLDPELVQEIVGIFIAYIIGQGIADHGKDAAKIAAAVEVSPNVAKEMVKDPSKP